MSGEGLTLTALEEILRGFEKLPVLDTHVRVHPATFLALKRSCEPIDKPPVFAITVESDTTMPLREAWFGRYEWSENAHGFRQRVFQVTKICKL